MLLRWTEANISALWSLLGLTLLVFQTWRAFVQFEFLSRVGSRGPGYIFNFIFFEFFIDADIILILKPPIAELERFLWNRSVWLLKTSSLLFAYR